MLGGYGASPLGAFAFGIGVPETATTAKTALLPDPATGLSQTGRLIVSTSPNTLDYSFKSDGRLNGMATVPQLVLLALKNIDFTSLEEKGPHFALTMRNLVQGALGPLITAKLVAIRQIVILEPTQDSGLAMLNWTDLTTNKPEQTPIGSTSP